MSDELWDSTQEIMQKNVITSLSREVSHMQQQNAYNCSIVQIISTLSIKN